MNRKLLASGTLAFLATSLLWQPHSLAGRQTTPPQGATLRGTVTRAGTSEPIADVNVLVTNGRVGPRGQQLQSLEEMVNTALARGAAIPANIQAQLDAERATARGGTSNNLQLTTKSDRDGHFIVRDLPSGQYTVVIEREGFFGAFDRTNYTVALNTTVTVTAGKTLPELALSLVPSAAISGRVVDPEGQPIVNSGVQAFSLTYSNGTPNLQWVAGANTDDRGDYRLYRIPPGEYYLAVTPRQSGGRGLDGGFGGGGFGARGRAIVPNSGDALVRTFYPDTIDSSGARLLVLGGGKELSGITITARRSPTFKISGQITSSVALPTQTNARGATQFPVVQFILVRQDKNIPEDSSTRSTLAVSTDGLANGKFEIPGVIPGSYDLFARVNNPVANAAAVTASNEPPAYFGRTSFIVGNQDVAGLPVLLRPGADLKAYLTMDGSPPPPNSVRVSIVPEDNSRLVPGYQAVRGAQAPGADGMLALNGVNAGRYRLNATFVSAGEQRSASAPTQQASAYVEDIREGGLSVFDSGLLVGQEQPRQIEIVIKTNGGTVQGTVFDATLQPKRGAWVVLIPAQNRRENLALYKTAGSDDKGQFEMVGIAPGQYKLFAWENVAAAAYKNATFISKYEQQGSSISVNAAATTSAQVTVIAAEK